MYDLKILMGFTIISPSINRSTNGRYLGATKNGTFKLLDEGRETATQWEY